VPKARWLAVASLLVVSGVGFTHSASASPLDDKRAEAKHINDQITGLQNEAFDVGAQYDRVQAELDKVNVQVAAAQARVGVLDRQVSSMRTAMQGFAVQSYIGGVEGEGIEVLLGAGDSPAVAAQRDQYTELVLGSSMTRIDQFESFTQDAARERKLLETKQAQKRKLEATLESKQTQITKAIQKANTLQSTVKGQLATLVAQDQLQQAQQAAAREQARERRARDLAAATTTGTTIGHRSRSSSTTSNPSTTSTSPRSTRSSGSSSSHTVPSGPRAGGHVPAPSPGAAGAVAAALSQLGVGYRFATAIPGVAFDCSGLTAWAWGQAGVSLPHQSRSQYAVLPHVSQSQVQPGDLLFYYNPIGHVAMYIGGGRIVQATRPGDVVSISTANWSRVVGIGRP